MTYNLKNKEPFFVFTAINGVLCDGEFAFQKHGPFAKSIENPILKSSSIDALTLLLNTLEEKYDTKLVITSKRRSDLPACMQYLHDYGFKYDKPVFATKYEKGERGRKILNFMENEGIAPAKTRTLSNIVDSLFSAQTDKPFKNYAVIDSSLSRIKHFIPKSHIIKTNPRNASLTQTQVEEFLSQIGLSTANMQTGE